MLRFFLAALLAPASVYACSICGCGDPMEAAGQSIPMAGQWRLGLDWEQLSVRAVSDEDPERRDTLSQWVLAPTLSYSPGQSLNIALRLPWNEKKWESFGGADEPEGGITAGLGDLDLGARWFFAQSMDMAAHGSRFAALSLGSTLNTGANGLENDGLRIDEHNQPGTGAAGPYAGFLLGDSREGWKLTFHAGYFSHATNLSAYQYGSALKAGVGVRRELSEVHALGLALEGRYADYDRADTLIVLNSGGTLLELTPSLHLKFGEKFALGFKARLPIFVNLFGGQDIAPSFVSSLQFILN